MIMKRSYVKIQKHNLNKQEKVGLPFQKNSFKEERKILSVSKVGLPNRTHKFLFYLNCCQYILKSWFMANLPIDVLKNWMVFGAKNEIK